MLEAAPALFVAPGMVVPETVGRQPPMASGSQPADPAQDESLHRHQHDHQQ
jgi:hypothetical protein